MNVRLIAVGRIREPYVARACDDFRRRLRAYFPYEEIEVKAADGSDPRQAMREEAERILKLVRPDDLVWLLERTGDELSTEDLRRRVQDVTHGGTSRLTLVVGGTFGAGDALLSRADFRLSLSRLTFLHEWARMLVLEQLYRVAKIARNEPYHH